jgi:hypothetical protein
MCFRPFRSGRRSSSFSAFRPPASRGPAYDPALLLGFVLAGFVTAAQAAPPYAYAETRSSSADGLCDPLLREEVRLAEATRLYVIVGVANRHALLKAKGIPVRSFSVLSASFVGGPWDTIVASTVLEKRPSIEPTPTRPPPPGAETAKRTTDVVPQPLARTAMPTYYELRFADGLSVLVHQGGADSLWGQVSGRFGSAIHWAKARVLSGWSRLWGAPRRFLLLAMPPEEAQAFYWAVRPLMPVVVNLDTC